MFRSVGFWLAFYLFGESSSTWYSPPYDECYPSYTGCPADCENLVTDEHGTHCQCYKDYTFNSEMKYCADYQCHDPGCDQCKDGYFKRDYSSPCVKCSDVFGDACKSCTDFSGCNECADPNKYERIEDTSCDSGTDSGFYYCRPRTCTHPPTKKPTKPPTKWPTKWPTNKPTKWPTPEPTKPPTKWPTDKPTKWPTKWPTESPTKPPTKWPTDKPTKWPTKWPTESPTKPPTKWPTDKPTKWPTKWPTESPTKPPTKWPTDKPTKWPTKWPTESPTKPPTKWPTDKPTKWPTKWPTESPTKPPTKWPTKWPTSKPTKPPTKWPTKWPTDKPTTKPPTKWPTKWPTDKPVKNECPWFDGLWGTIEKCENDPCKCTEKNLNCKEDTCHEHPGCNQCKDGYWKLDYNYKCEQCQDTFGPACEHCTDFLGCQQCTAPAMRDYNHDCGIYYCKYP